MFCRKLAVLRAVLAAVFPDDDLVELDVRDRLGRGVGQVVEVFEHQQLERLLRAAAGFDDLLQAFALLGQDLVLAAGFGVELGEDGRGFAFGLDAALLGRRLRRRRSSGPCRPWPGASTAARCSASTRSASASAALAMARFCASSTAASASRFLRFADLIGFGLLHRAGSPSTRRSMPWAVFSPSMALALASAVRDAHFALGVLHLRVALVSRPSARRSSVPSPARRGGPPARASRLASADLAVPWRRWRPGSSDRARPRRRAFRPSSPARRRRRGPAEWPARRPSGRWRRCSRLRR